MSIIESLRTKFEALMPYMDEKLRRLWAASEAGTLGKGGVIPILRNNARVNEKRGGKKRVNELLGKSEMLHVPKRKKLVLHFISII